MQPYFFPYLGHFGLIASVDEWVVFDVTQYTPKTWMNRNRVLHPSTGWNYITVPLANSSIRITTAEAQILDPAAARRSLLGKLCHYKRKAPGFDTVLALIDEAFADATDDSLVRLNARGLRAVCRCLGLPFRFRILSELGLELPEKPGAGGWAPFLCERLGATSYVNPAGGQALFAAADFTARGIALFFAETALFPYETAPFAFEPGLSILDVLMWNSPERVAAAIRDGTRLMPAR
ncbi:MAG: WbqC family protein [Alphaproteobacteria bacterium]|nr:WbqC family protein [Alphaproteobacteria bacterium]